jgi:hypothetical protein
MRTELSHLRERWSSSEASPRRKQEDYRLRRRRPRWLRTFLYRECRIVALGLGQCQWQERREPRGPASGLMTRRAKAGSRWKRDLATLFYQSTTEMQHCCRTVRRRSVISDHIGAQPRERNRGASRTSNIKAAMNRNLSRRPAKPALGNGRVQRGIRRALWVLGTASTTEIMEWTHSRIRGRRCDANRAARHALDQLAIRINE